ncbi:MAG: phosphoribosylformylglycinamidine cyclo-ligase [Deltaproteobacteria bacterium]|nr:phosphoribosylformylglycinamidine cyclo-ligase [Deltaproteobacteria bacterium]
MDGKDKDDSYAQAGVDIDAGNLFVKRIQPIVSKSFRPGVISNVGGFAGLFSLNLQDVKNPVLVSSTDGVGTKLKIAFMMDKHDTVGIDLVAMCVNDIVVQGAYPLFMLDYIAAGKLNVDRTVDIVKGIVTGCEEAECALIGGETAEMPDFYKEGEYDLAGFVVGLADNDQLLVGSEVAMGHQLIGIASSGLHSNGYSLARRIFFDKLKMSVTAYVEEFGRTLGEELLEPTRIYAKTIKNVIRNYRISGISHITGGGLIDNVPRILPKQCKVIVNTTTWNTPPVFQFLREAGNLSFREMMRTFNCGLGMIMIVNDGDTDEVLSRLRAMGEIAYRVGEVASRKDDEDPIQFTE